MTEKELNKFRKTFCKGCGSQQCSGEDEYLEGCPQYRMFAEKDKKLINKLKKAINDLRDMRSGTIKSDTLSEEQLYYLQEGYREGLCAAAMLLADELDAELQGEIDCPEDFPIGSLIDIEEQWWHSHTDEENGDAGTDDRYKLD